MFQHAVFNHRYSSRGDAFVVEFIRAVQLHAVQFLQRGVVGDTQELRQHQLIHFLRERLAFFHAALALSLDAMAEYFMEEDGGGASRKQRRSAVRLNDRRGAQLLHVLAKFFQARQHFGVRRQMRRVVWRENFGADQIHAVVGARVGGGDHLDQWMLEDFACAFGRNEETRLVAGREKHAGVVNIRKLAEHRGVLLDLLLPRRDVGRDHRRRVLDANLRLFLAEVGGGVLFLGAHRRVGLHLQIRARRHFVFLIRGFPQHARDGVGIVLEGKQHTVHAGLPAFVVRVVEIGRRDAYGNIDAAHVRLNVVQHRALHRRKEPVPFVGDRIADVVRRRVALRQIFHGALQFFLDGVHQHGARRWLRRYSGRGGCRLAFGLLRAGGKRQQKGETEYSGRSHEGYDKSIAQRNALQLILIGGEDGAQHRDRLVALLRRGGGYSDVAEFAFRSWAFAVEVQVRTGHGENFGGLGQRADQVEHRGMA